MKLPAIKFAKVTALVSVLAGIGYVAHVVFREVTYVHAKISRSPSVVIMRPDLRWPETAALPELRVSFPETKEQLGAITDGAWRK